MNKIERKIKGLREGIEPKVDARELALNSKVGAIPMPEERAVLILSSVYAAQENPDYVVISWAMQEKAAAFFNAHGLYDTLSEIVRVGGPEYLEK